MLTALAKKAPDLDPDLFDFKNFLAFAWETLKLPPPTRLQYDVAEWMQDPTIDRLVILAFRGFGKSWITSMFGDWRLLLDPQRKFLNTSASSGKSDQATRFMLQMINLMPELQHLSPGPDQRSSNISFDVAGALPAHAPSVLSLGIQSNLMQGSRCDDFCGDDVESKKNSQTMQMRARIEDMCRELGGSILRSSDEVIEPKGIYLGTPQIEDSLYFKLEEKGYRVLIYPSEYPDAATNKLYDGRLAPILQADLDADPSLVGKPTEPGRFSERVLLQRRKEYGKLGYKLQFQLMPSLATEDRYPLKLNDCVVMDLDADVGPEKVLWESQPKDVVDDVPCVGFSRDFWHGPAAVIGGYRAYTHRVMTIDPSAGGGDECAYCVGFALNSQIFLMDVGGFRVGNSPETLNALAAIAKKWRVRNIDVEKNYGGGMWTQLFRPSLRKIYPQGCHVEEIQVSGRKELRNIDILDAPMDSHRVIINKSAIQNDYDSVQDYPVEATLDFQLFYQVSRLTPDSNCLAHDDRLDAFALLVAHFTDTMSRDADEQIAIAEQEDLDQKLEDYNRAVEQFGVDGYLAPTGNTWMRRS